MLTRVQAEDFTSSIESNLREKRMLLQQKKFVGGVVLVVFLLLAASWLCEQQ